jgi:hypothetical protein
MPLRNTRKLKRLLFIQAEYCSYVELSAGGAAAKMRLPPREVGQDLGIRERHDEEDSASDNKG